MIATTIADVIKSIRDLPSLPAVILELMGSIDQEDASIKQLAIKISQDPALSAKALRLANSSFYGMQCMVTTIQQAIAVLGFDTVRTLVTSAAVIDKFSGTEKGGFNYQMFWRQSIATAICAKLLARHQKQHEDQTFMAALLHDIGILVLVTHCPECYVEIKAHQTTHDCSMLDAEVAILGFNHAIVGRKLAEYWKFPLAIQIAIEHYHRPDLQEKNSIASLIYVADAIVCGLDLCGDENTVVPLVSSEIWDELNIEPPILISLFRETELLFEQTCKILL